MIYPITIDLETTDTDTDTASICQMAAVMSDFSGEEPRSVTLLSMYCNPGVPISKGAQEIHGISDEDVMWATPAIWGLRHLDMTLKALEKTGQVVICGQNHERFDIPVMKRMLPEAGFELYPSIDTYTIALREFPSMPHTLGEFYEWYCEKPAIDAHDAAADCHMVAAILGKYLNTHKGGDILELAEELKEAHVLYTMPFGKHKGLPMKDVPSGYLRWCRANWTDSHKDLDATICAVLGC